MRDVVKILVGLALIVFFIAIGPWLVIWALNTLFPALAIPYTFETWGAVVLLGGLGNMRLSK